MIRKGSSFYVKEKINEKASMCLLGFEKHELLELLMLMPLVLVPGSHCQAGQKDGGL